MFLVNPTPNWYDKVGFAQFRADTVRSFDMFEILTAFFLAFFVDLWSTLVVLGSAVKILFF